MTAFRSDRRRILHTLAACGIAPAAAWLGAADARAAAPELVFGDQAGGLRALAEAAHVLDGAPYPFRWANFQGAAPLFEAQRANAVDLAPAGDLPVLAAAIGDPSLKIVATRVGTPSSLGIVVQADSPLRHVADLKGKTVVVSSARGSISQYQLYGALAEAGLTRDDVNVRFVLPVDAFAAFESRQLDVWATFDPYYGSAVQRGARVLRDGSGINTGLAFITASGAAAADLAKRPALIDALQRFQRAGAWAAGHPEAYAQVYATLTRLPIEAARIITVRSALKQRPVSDADIATLQRVADEAFEQRMLPAKVDVRAITLQGMG
ncbi:ABC transporter substrate-binding protein [Paraburkholderia phenazinium]|jgi:sulfonate transport system substrate-binding protein|uniref:Putative aliphatic sulfonates-binding protein n=1 Tax=Paraburkholderia phenazinium TaxID=60549 RepID=A0A1N6KJR1_9BURK|nr:ABC transporter substrate-binding protein [Paraburkholderia phenazinium]SIO56683.1 ABC-type nitrate/sulfonate/bicarbonate transport system, substrate-binding protein [Paraburkholderia phenazinium]